MIRKLKCDIGNLIYEKYKDGEMPEKALKGFCEEICQHEQIIKGYEETAADMKGKKICPECGKYVDKKAAFCSWCGAVCPTEKKEKPEEEPSSEEARQGTGDGRAGERGFRRSKGSSNGGGSFSRSRIQRGDS